MKNIRIFEAFAGIGSQYQALKNISKEKNWNIQQVGIIEWYIPAIIAYQVIHYHKLIKPKQVRLITTDITLSNDSKKPLINLAKIDGSKTAYYINQSIINSHNFFDITKASLVDGENKEQDPCAGGYL